MYSLLSNYLLHNNKFPLGIDIERYKIDGHLIHVEYRNNNDSFVLIKQDINVWEMMEFLHEKINDLKQST